MNGVTQLGYLGFEVSNLDAWEGFATKVLGLRVADRREGGAFSLRMDSHARRFFIEPGALDDVAVIGWQVDGEAGLAETVERLRAASVEVVDGTADEAKARGVARLMKLRDPNGIPTELFYGPEMPAEPFKSPLLVSSFVADDMGLGHLVIAARDKAESVAFYTNLLGFRLSDHIVTEIYGYKADMDFFHVNRRHHSLAIGGRMKKRTHHFMLETRAMDDVGLAFDRAIRAGVPIVQTLGKHPNDRMFSFYAKTPSGIQIEFGWGGREVDDASWEPTTYDCISEWGHHPPAVFAGTLKVQGAKQ